MFINDEFSLISQDPSVRINIKFMQKGVANGSLYEKLRSKEVHPLECDFIDFQIS